MNAISSASQHLERVRQFQQIRQAVHEVVRDPRVRDDLSSDTRAKADELKVYVGRLIDVKG